MCIRIVMNIANDKRPDLGWNWLELKKPQQDTLGYTDPETGEVYPPTFRWHCKILARRTDGQYVYVVVSLGEEAPPTLFEDFQHALLSLESMRVKEFPNGQ